MTGRLFCQNQDCQQCAARQLSKSSFPIALYNSDVFSRSQILYLAFFGAPCTWIVHLLPSHIFELVSNALILEREHQPPLFSNLLIAVFSATRTFASKVKGKGSAGLPLDFKATNNQLKQSFTHLLENPK